MAKINEKYEALVILSVKNGEDAVASLNQKINDFIAKNATIDSVDDWGKRRLAYPINYETEANYVLYQFTCPASFPTEFDRVLKITDGVLRSLVTLRVENTAKPAPKAEAKSEEATAKAKVSE